jgi:hypothetical protein
MSFELVLNFTPDGAVDAMHMDRFDLSFLGKKHVQRATEIKFDDESQLWGLHLPLKGSEGYYPVTNGQGFDSYETARDFEVAWLNICRYRNEEPGGVWGVVALKALRQIDRVVSVEEFFRIARDLDTSQPVV